MLYRTDSVRVAQLLLPAGVSDGQDESDVPLRAAAVQEGGDVQVQDDVLHADGGIPLGEAARVAAGVNIKQTSGPVRACLIWVSFSYFFLLFYSFLRFSYSSQPRKKRSHNEKKI